MVSVAVGEQDDADSAPLLGGCNRWRPDARRPRAPGRLPRTALTRTDTCSSPPASSARDSERRPSGLGVLRRLLGSPRKRAFGQGWNVLYFFPAPARGRPHRQLEKVKWNPCRMASPAVISFAIASRASSGSEHDEVAGAAQDLAHEPGGAGVGSSTTTAPSASSSTTVRSSRSQRARSGETQTRGDGRGRHLAVGHPALDPGDLLDLGPRLEALLGEARLLDPVELEVADPLFGQVVALDAPAPLPFSSR